MCKRLPTQYRNRKIDLLYLVVNGNFTPLLSCSGCLDLEVLQFMNLDLIKAEHVVPVTEQDQDLLPDTIASDPILTNFKDCFSNKPGRLPREVTLEIDESVTPVIHPPRRIATALYDPVREKLLEIEQDGIIVRQEEHTPWVNSMMVTDKRRGKGKGPPTKDDMRICIDPKDINTALKRVHHRMVTIEEVANKLTSTVVFSTLDVSSGFWQLPVDELLTFNTPWGRYRFCRLPWPFGVAPAPEIYQREMERLLEGVPVEIFVDDFLTHAHDREEMDEKLTMVLERSREVGLKFNPDKLKLRVDKVNYVGHTLTSQDLQPDPEKIRAIVDMPSPSDKEGVQRLLGTVNYLDKFIENKAAIQGPISQLLQKDAAFVWDTQQQLAFDELKQVISKSPVLAYFDNNKQIVLNADASSTVLAAVVMQDGKPIAYGSRTLTSSEKHYANIERELLAIC